MQVPINGPTPRTTLKRLAQRGVHEHEAVLRILDEGLVCHMAFVVDGQPYVLPTAYARIGDDLYLHGSSGNRMLRTGRSGLGICVTVTLLDGLVLARSAFHHSMNYRSVVLLGSASAVEDVAEKQAAFRALVEHVAPGRYGAVRAPTPEEIARTLVLRLPITEGSAKVRSGPPIDDEPDYALPVWAGVVPLALRPGAPVPDARLEAGRPLPDYPSSYVRG
jgi:nitroimidazol reductase NimA-like FMN-containing flavoprotein (pyridoxamine 5'-phosphate oxidase superfamily)